jgi:hypothetical protein
LQALPTPHYISNCLEPLSLTPALPQSQKQVSPTIIMEIPDADLAPQSSDITVPKNHWGPTGLKSSTIFLLHFFFLKGVFVTSFQA